MRERGMSVLEPTVSLLVIVVLAGILSDRLLNYVRLSEQAAVQQAIGTMRTAMYLELGRRAGGGDIRAVWGMTGQNPVDWLTQPPDGYLGDLRGPDPRALPGGSWYYDSERRELVYAPRRLAWYGRLPEDGVFRFQVRVQAGTLQGQGSGISGVELRPVGAYEWFRI